MLGQKSVYFQRHFALFDLLYKWRDLNDCRFLLLGATWLLRLSVLVSTLPICMYTVTAYPPCCSWESNLGESDYVTGQPSKPTTHVKPTNKLWQNLAQPNLTNIILTFTMPIKYPCILRQGFKYWYLITYHSSIKTMCF